jgi:hypothetical protein
MYKEFIIGFGGAIFGGVFSLLGSYMSIRASYRLIEKNFRNQQLAEFQKTLRCHLEELHINVNNMTTYLNTIYYDVDNYFNGKLSKDALKSSIDKVFEKRKYDKAKIEMIVSIYFKDLKDDYEKYYDLVFNYISELNNLSSFLKGSEEIDDQSKDKFIKELERNHDLINEESDRLLETISVKLD